jgi:8-oxo-dGTP pyrophosphatase MutT (NUDIX family)
MKMKDLIPNIIKEQKESVTTIFQNKWLSLKKIKSDGAGDGYIYSHETRCDGKIIAVIPYRKKGNGLEYIVRRETTPCWGLSKNSSALTGGVESYENPKQCALKELREESGYICKPSDLEFLGNCFGTKSCDTVYYLYAVDVDKCELGEKSGDGSKYDEEGTVKWISSKNDISKIKCPIWNTLYVRLISK